MYDFWRRSVSLVYISRYRVVFGLLLTIESLSWLPHTTELFSTDGLHLNKWANLALPQPFAIVFIFVLCIFSASFTVGFLTRMSIAVVLAMRLYLYLLNSVSEKAIYSISLVVLSILLFSSCDAYYSVDRRLREKKGLPTKTNGSIFLLRFLQIEFAHIYLGAGITKMRNWEWVHGTVIPKILNGRWATDTGLWVAANAPEAVFRAVGMGTILFEVFAGFLLFVGWARPFVVACGILMHISIEVCLAVEFIGLHFLNCASFTFPTPREARY